MILNSIKRILAIIAIILLVGMYASTLIIALNGGPNVMTFLGLSIAFTVLTSIKIPLRLAI